MRVLDDLQFHICNKTNAPINWLSAFANLSVFYREKKDKSQCTLSQIALMFSHPFCAVSNLYIMVNRGANVNPGSIWASPKVTELFNGTTGEVVNGDAMCTM